MLSTRQKLPQGFTRSVATCCIAFPLGEHHGLNSLPGVVALLWQHTLGLEGREKLTLSLPFLTQLRHSCEICGQIYVTSTH